MQSTQEHAPAADMANVPMPSKDGMKSPKPYYKKLQTIATPATGLKNKSISYNRIVSLTDLWNLFSSLCSSLF